MKSLNSTDVPHVPIHTPVRVGGRGKAVITDIIYSSNETSSEEAEKPSSESREKYDSLKVHHHRNITL